MDTGTKERTVLRELAQLGSILDVYFPAVEFHVCCRQQGDDHLLDIAYTDGVSSRRVWNAVKHLQRRAQPEIHMAGVRIGITRKMSEAVRDRLLAETKSIFRMKQTPGESDYFEHFKGTVGNYIQTIFKMRDF